MSNIISEQLHGTSQEVSIGLSELGRVERAAKQLGASATIHLGDELSFADIFSGRVPIGPESVIFDRNGVQIDAVDLLTHVECEVGV
jgi:hypothetical protein